MDGQHSWAISERPPVYLVSTVLARLVSIYNIVGRTWMASIPVLSL